MVVDELQKSTSIQSRVYTANVVSIVFEALVDGLETLFGVVYLQYVNDAAKVYLLVPLSLTVDTIHPPILSGEQRHVGYRGSGETHLTDFSLSLNDTHGFSPLHVIAVNSVRGLFSTSSFLTC